VVKEQQRIQHTHRRLAVLVEAQDRLPIIVVRGLVLMEHQVKEMLEEILLDPHITSLLMQERAVDRMWKKVET
jgi:hypothetical protein